MIWALVSSAYVIYLYRKLAADGVGAPEALDGEPREIPAELDALEKRIGAIEAMLDRVETAR